eukprot:Lankesteria_metandrocarpae@DN1206_c0_g1_i1.p1
MIKINSVLVLLLLLGVVVPTLAMRGSHGNLSTHSPKGSTSDRRSIRRLRSKAIRARADAVRDVQKKIDALPICLKSDGRKEVENILNNPQIDSSPDMNVVELGFMWNSANKIHILEEYLIPMVSGQVSDLLRNHLQNGRHGQQADGTTGDDPMLIAFAQHKEMQQQPSTHSGTDLVNLMNPYVCYPPGRLSYYVVTSFIDIENSNNVVFVAHEFTPHVHSDGSTLTGILSPVNTAVFRKHSSGGVFLFQEREGQELLARTCVLDHSVVSRGGNLQVYIFHWTWSYASTYGSDPDNFYKHSGRGDATPLLVLSSSRQPL